MPTINVIKPFTLSSLARSGSDLPSERHFGVGEHDISVEMAAHPYIKDYADGHIETPKGAKLRADQAKADADASQLRANAANAAAHAALDRVTRRQAVTNQSVIQQNADLQTPTGELKSAQGSGITVQVAQTESQKAYKK